MIANHIYVSPFSSFIRIGDLVVTDKKSVIKIVNIINKDCTMILKEKKMININDIGDRIL